jgi:hypothetical protein
MFTVMTFDPAFHSITDETEIPTAIGAIEYAAHLQHHGHIASAFLVEGERYFALGTALVEVEGRIEDAICRMLTAEPRETVSASTGI